MEIIIVVSVDNVRMFMLVLIFIFFIFFGDVYRGGLMVFSFFI